MIPYGRQWITDEDIDACRRVLRSDFLTQGPEVELFEGAVADHVGAPHAVAVNSATSALHIAYLALGLGPGDVLWTSPITFVATSNAALLTGASVDFVDINSKTHNMCVRALEKKLVQAEAVGRLPRIVAPVHLAGEPCDMAEIGRLSRRYGFRVVEDASHAVGAQQYGHHIGSCQYSDITIFSFHPVKIITTAEGGMALTRDAALAGKMRRLRSHGITRDPLEMVGPSDGPWYYQQQSLGLNYRMTDIQAALGRSQLKRIDDFLSRRHELAVVYDEAFKEFEHSYRSPDAYSALHLYILQWPSTSRLSRQQAFEALRAAGIGVNVHYIPVHTQPYYKNMGFQEEMFPTSMEYYRRAITLPLFPHLMRDEQKHVIDTVLQLTC